jgi:hypothetical protein
MADDPIESTENYNLLQTNLSNYILNEIGVDVQDHESSSRSSFTAADIALDPLSVLSQAFDSALSTNIVEGKVSAGYYAIVLLAFTDGPEGAPACKAVVPGLHDSMGNPFRGTDENERAMMISHFPTFVYEDKMTATTSPIVPGSVIKVAFDNPYNYWTSGVIEKVIRGKPKVLPEYAENIEGVLDLFNDPLRWASAFFLGETTVDDGTFIFNDNAGSTSSTAALAPAQYKGTGPANANEGIIEFVSEMAKHAQQKGLPVPVITSTYRDNPNQASVMAKNWYLQGATASGWSVSRAKSYITKLYSSGGMGAKYHAAFLTGHTGGQVTPAGKAACVAVLDAKSVGSEHSANPSNACDLRMNRQLDRLYSSFIGMMPAQKINGTIKFAWTSPTTAKIWNVSVLSEKDHRHMEMKS